MHSYLALGDSYTIGEQVPINENFPNQTVKLLAEQHVEVSKPLIIAVTGWTTDELANAIREHSLNETFSFVTLLIGVNNQYRGRTLENYKEEFTRLIEQAIIFANGRADRVYVLSIPDWGVTPFAKGRDRAQIALEIDAYNAANKDITEAFKSHYIDITDSTRIHGSDKEYVAEDGLHPSATEYTVWAERLAKHVAKDIKQ